MSRELALRVARERSANVPVVMATIEAESGFRNVLGAYGAPSAAWGAGFGQVHPAWHAADVQDVAARLNVQLPPGFGPVPWRAGNQVWDRFARQDPAAVAVRRVIDDIILRNSEFSMQLAVQVIQKIWDASGRDFDRFLRSYVGPAIPAADVQRRKRMLERWQRELGQAPVAPPAQAPAPGYDVAQVAGGISITGPGLADLDVRNIVLFTGAMGLAAVILWKRGQLLDE